MPQSPSVDDLLRTCLDDFDNPGRTLTATARRALRIAALRRDYVNQLWLQWELIGLLAAKGDPTGPAAKILDQLKTLLGPVEALERSKEAIATIERNRSVEIDGSNRLLGHSLAQLESQYALQQKLWDDASVPPNLTPIDTYMYAKQMDANKAKILPGMQQQVQVIEQIRTSIYSFLLATEADLDEGQRESPLFTRAQEYINAALASYAPDALEKFLSAQQRMDSGSSEDLAQALTSCRRMVKALADALYPPTGEQIVGDDGVTRRMSDEQYRNRIQQYVKECLRGNAHGKVIQSTLDGLGARLKSLDSLASKGVHDQVSVAEAESCVVWTYLLAADVLRVADGSSAAFTSPAGSTDDR